MKRGILISKKSELFLPFVQQNSTPKVDTSMPKFEEKLLKSTTMRGGGGGNS